MSDALLDPVLAHVRHGFGTRGAPAPPDVRRPVQVHGTRVAHASEPSLGEADAVVATDAGTAVGIVTADCVPVLATTGSAVVAIHAGWRGLAAGVIEVGVAALREAAPGQAVRAAIGPHIGACCYEVDAPVWTGLQDRFGARVGTVLTATRPGHARIDLGALARAALEGAGVEEVGLAQAACTQCDAERFESYRRDGAAAGRLLHWIVAPG